MARALDSERVWVEDVRNLSGSLERFLIDRGETVVRLAPRLMADARRGMRERGKSDPIDAAPWPGRAAQGVENTPDRPAGRPRAGDPDARADRERLVDMRTRLSNERRWQLHDLWPDWRSRPRRSGNPLADARSEPGSLTEHTQSGSRAT